MIERIRKSLVNKIIFFTAAISFLFVVLVSLSFQKIGNQALYKAEMEKAEFICNTAAELLSVNLYLGLEQNIDQLARQLIDNKNILQVKIFAGEKMIRSLQTDSALIDGNTFTVTSKILQPNSNEALGRLELLYSSQYYLKALNQYHLFGVIMAVLFTVIIIFLSLYVKKLLRPLNTIRHLLTQYSPDQELHFPFGDRNDEIGLISTAFNTMQKKITQFTQMQSDINSQLEEKVAEKTRELHHHFYFDSLTGVPNRISLMESLQYAREGALLIINIDDFKEVNDFLGNAIGDKFLIQFATKLQKSFETYPNLLFARLNGDEFAIHIYEPITKEKLIGFIDTMLSVIEKMRFFHEETEVTISVTIGATLQMDSAIEKSDIALKLAKKESKTYLLYDESYSVEHAYKSNIEWVKKLKDAIAHDRLVPFYQPIFDNCTEEVVSYESLIRMRDIDGSIITPIHFLNISKKSKLYTKLTKIVIEKSCATFEHLPYTFSVNLSFEDIINEEITSFIKERVTHYGVGERIIFEILESEGIKNYQEVANFIQQVHQMGCKIAIDDFGSGYSNYEHLLKLHIDYIKFDGSLIKNIDKDINAQIIVQTILDFAQKLNIGTVAEYVHSEAVFEYVKKLKIDRSQGFYLAQPRERT